MGLRRFTFILLFRGVIWKEALHAVAILVDHHTIRIKPRLIAAGIFSRRYTALKGGALVCAFAREVLFA
jgi:hypothetical protein